MNEDLSELIKSLSERLNSDIPKDSENSENEFQNTDEKERIHNNDKSSSSEDFNIDFETILKFKTIFDNLNSNEIDDRTNLLRSLKPYLKNSKKDKLEQYIKFLKLAKLFETINPLGGDNNDIFNLFR